MTVVMSLALIAIAVIVRNVSLHQFNLPPMKNKRVPPKKQNTKMQLARRLLEDDSSDVVSIDSNSSDS